MTPPCNDDRALASTPGEKEEGGCGGKQEDINRIEQLVKEKASLERKLKEKKERLDKLKLVKLYRTKVGLHLSAILLPLTKIFAHRMIFQNWMVWLLSGDKLLKKLPKFYWPIHAETPPPP